MKAATKVKRGSMKAAVVAAMVFGLVLIGGAPAPLGAQQSVWDGVYTMEQAERGAEIYGPECSVCHGGELEGIDMAPPLRGGRFGSNWNGVPLSELARRIRITMPMDNPGSLNSRQTADVLAYILNANAMPAGEMELPRRAGMLQQIVYQPRKPPGGQESRHDE